MERRKSIIYSLVVVFGLLMALPAISYVVTSSKPIWADLVTIVSPTKSQDFDYHPVEIVVSLKDGAIASTFTASLNQKDITSCFTPITGGLLHAYVTPADGLKCRIIGLNGTQLASNSLIVNVQGSGNTYEQAATKFQVEYKLVNTKRDDKGVWFITGGSLGDVMDAMGYAVATDRLWQIEKYRRSAKGTLSEVFGSSQLPTDTFMRTIGYTSQELTDGFNALDKEAQIVVNSYVNGINRRIAEVKANPALTPYEFLATGCLLNNWTASDVLAWGALMLRQFDCEALATGQIGNSLLFQKLTASSPYGYGPKVGYGMFNDLRWLNDPKALTYIPPAAPTARAMAQAAPSAGIQAPKIQGTPAESSDLEAGCEDLINTIDTVKENLKKINADVKMGSYAWAISKNKTKYNLPIIYSGPQMGFQVPSIILEGSINGGGLNISGMVVPGLPAICVGRTPHHAWSMQVGHARTVDYYLETTDTIALNRVETIRVKNLDGTFTSKDVPVYRSIYGHGPIINQSPLIAWKYSHWVYEFKTIPAYLKLARAQSMDDFGNALNDVGVSMHFCYADRDGNIAYWMSGRDPVRQTSEWRLPQGALGAWKEWDPAVLIPKSTDRNNAKGYYCGWNNKSNPNYIDSINSTGYSFGPFHRAHVVDDYLKSNNNLTFEEVRDLALYIASTDSFGGGGIPWEFVKDDFTSAVLNAGPNASREAALDLLDEWDGHFVAGGPSQWAQGVDRADAWVLQDKWIREVIRLTFQDELTFPDEMTPGGTTYSKESVNRLFNVLLHSLAGASSGVVNTYPWFTNKDLSAPQTADAIIVQALDTTLASLSTKPWGTWGKDQRGVITYRHDILGPVHTMPFSSRSTYAHCVEFGTCGPIRIESMFPLGESGTILFNGTSPVYDANFFSMTPIFDQFIHRPFPLF